MHWIRPTRLPILIAWLAILGVLAWVGTHPRVVAPFLSRLVTRQLMSQGGGTVKVADFRIRPFEGMDLYGVSVSLPGSDRGLTLISADTVRADFSLADLTGETPRLRKLVVQRPEVYARLGNHHDTEPETAGKKDAGFVRLGIDQLEIQGAFLEFSGSDGRLLERVSHVEWNGSVHSGDRIHLMLHGCDVAWDTRESLLTGLRGEIVIDDQEFAVPSAFGKLNGNEVRVEGFRRWDGLLDLAVDAHGVSIPEVENLIDLTIGFHARGDLQANFFARGDTVVYSGLFNGELEGYQMSDLVGRAVITEKEVVAEGLQARVNGAWFDGSGLFLVPDEEHVSFVLEGDVADADLAAGLVPEAEDLPRTDGRGHVKIEHEVASEWTRVTGVLRDGFVEVAPFDSCQVDVVAWPDSVDFRDITLHYGPMQAKLTGTSDRDEIFRGRLQAETSDLSLLPPDWQVPPLAGSAQAAGTLAGPLEDLTFVGDVTGSDVEMDRLAAGAAGADLRIGDLLEDPFVSGAVAGTGLRIGGVDFGEFQAVGAASAHSARIDSFRTVLGDTLVRLAGGASFSDTLQLVDVGRFEISLEGTRWAMEDRTSFSVGRDRFLVPGLKIRSEHGELTTRGEYRRDQYLDGELHLRGFDLALLDPFVETREPLRGRVTADVTLGGEPGDALMQMQGSLVDAPFALAQVDSLHVEGTYQQGAFHFRDLDLRTNYGDVTGHGSISHPGAALDEFWPGAELDAELQVAGGDWAFMEQFELEALDRMAGSFDGKVTVAGTTDDPLMRGEVRSSPFHIHWLHLDELEGQVWADRSTLVLGDLAGRKESLAVSGRIEIPLDLDFLHEPVAPLQGPFYMQLSIPPGSNLEPVSRMTNAFIQTSGTGSGSVVISGPLEHPLYQGEVELSEAGFVIRDMAEVYRGISATGVFEGDQLRIANIQGREGLRGRLTGSGTLDFEGLLLKGFDVQLELDRFLLATVPDLRVVFNSDNARISSAYAGPDSVLVPRFSGAVEVVKGRYTGDFKEKPGQVDPMAATVAPEWLADLQLHGDPRTARILNREMELYLGGDLDLVRDLEGLYLRGTLDVNMGRLIVFNNTFQVDRGRLDFSREIGFDPQIDVEASTKHRMRSRFSNNSVIENIFVHVSRTLARPEIEFSSDQGYSREAIQRMLLGLDPYPDVTGGEVDQLRASSITAGFNVLEREIARELNLIDTFEIDQIRRENEAGSTGLDPLIGIGKYIGPDLYLKVAQGVKQEDRDIIVEYQINRHLLLQSEIRRRMDENQGQETYNLDLKYRFEY